MSEYQYVDFVAVDGPVSSKDLAFMRQQSTRGEISAWRFTNEYHYGDFRGNAKEMLRRGYDVHLHYANFGIRKIMIRLPGGLPCEKRVFADYEIKGSVCWEGDKRGPGGILTIEPVADAGTYEGDPDVVPLLDELVPLREGLMQGDLRPLFIAWLGCCYERDAAVPPVPAGLSKLTPALQALADFFEIPAACLRRAMRRSLPAPAAIDQSVVIEQWISRQGKGELQEVVAGLLSSDASAVRGEILAEIRRTQRPAAWPTTPSTGTYEEIREGGK